jgi:hypothetical protein
MARWVLIEIDDNADAEAYVESLKIGKTFMTINTGDSYKVQEAPVRVVGLYAKPVKFCECETPGKVARGEKLGWWVCTKCNKPQTTRWQMPNNLLAPPDIALRDNVHHVHTVKEGPVVYYHGKVLDG